MIKKDLFVQTINFIRDRNDAMDKLNEVFTAEFEESVFYPYFKYENQMLKLLAASFDYDDELMYDWISYYCFELDFGRKHKLGDVTKYGVPIPLGTPEELYDMLFNDACGGNIKAQKYQCKDCKHFVGGGDWNLCCTQEHEDAPWCGWLCYECTEACDKFEGK